MQLYWTLTVIKGKALFLTEIHFRLSNALIAAFDIALLPPVAELRMAFRITQ